MALGTITYHNYDQPGMKASDWGVRQRLVTIVGDNAVPAGGTPITAATFKLNSIDHMEFTIPYPLVNRQYFFDKTNSKIQIRVAAGTEFTGDASADRVQILITGR